MKWSEVVEATLGIEAWDGDEAALLLDLAREIAHNTERRFAPLTAYAVGLAVGAAARNAAPGSDDSLVPRARRAPLLEGHAAALRDALNEHAEDWDA